MTEKLPARFTRIWTDQTRIKMLDQLALLLFTSSRGHFGFTNSHEFVVNNFIGKACFDLKLAHIKFQDGEETVLRNTESFLINKGYKVLKTKGEWKHNSSSHAKEYYKDQLKLLSSHGKPYSLQNEDDFIIKTSDKSIHFYLKKGIEFLERNPQALCVRINAEPDWHLNGSTYIEEFIYRQDEDRTVYGSTFTFQPTILRTRDYLAALRIINNNLHLLDSVHCEILSGQVFKQFSDDKSPFYFFDPDLVWCEHIGEKEKLEKLNGITNQ